MFWAGITLFLICDLVVVVLVVNAVRRNRAAGGGPNSSHLAHFTKTAADETRRYMSAHYGGDVTALPTALQGLVDRLASIAKDQGMALDRATLKQLAALSVISLKAAPARDVRIAIESVA